VKNVSNEEEPCKDKEDQEKAELNEEITKLKEKCNQLIKEKEDLESEMKKKSVSNDNGTHTVGLVNSVVFSLTVLRWINGTFVSFSLIS
jgi:uncharacterized protein YlxW (UPF0749 family)